MLYGDVELVVNWDHDGQEIKAHPSSTIRNTSYMKRTAITWSLTCCNNIFGSRFVPKNCLFDNNGSSVFPNHNIESLISYLNSRTATLLLKVENPTTAFQVGNFPRLPYLYFQSERISIISQ